MITLSFFSPNALWATALPLLSSITYLVPCSVENTHIHQLYPFTLHPVSSQYTLWAPVPGYYVSLYYLLWLDVYIFFISDDLIHCFAYFIAAVRTSVKTVDFLFCNFLIPWFRPLVSFGSLFLPKLFPFSIASVCLVQITK